MSPDEMQDLRADFNERAAILEYDNGLTRDEAEAQAVRELVGQLQERTQRQSGIVAELAGADRRRLHPDLAEVLLALGLAADAYHAPAFGASRGRGAGTKTYRPRPTR